MGSKGLKIPVSVVRFRPWAPVPQGWRFQLVSRGRALRLPVIGGMPRVAAAALVLLIASAARAAEDQPVVVRHLLGLSVSGSDSGYGLGAQLGIRLSRVLLRVTLDVGGGTWRSDYLALTFRGDWLRPISEGSALVAGIGIGELSYGSIFDDPAKEVAVLTPEIAVLFGRDRLFGRIMAGLTGFVPLGPVAHPLDKRGQPISPPHVMATLLFSL